MPRYATANITCQQITETIALSQADIRWWWASLSEDIANSKANQFDLKKSCEKQAAAALAAKT